MVMEMTAPQGGRRGVGTNGNYGGARAGSDTNGCGRTQDVPRFRALDEVKPLLLLELTIGAHRLHLLSSSGWRSSCLDVISASVPLLLRPHCPLYRTGAVHTPLADWWAPLAGPSRLVIYSVGFYGYSAKPFHYS